MRTEAVDDLIQRMMKDPKFKTGFEEALVQLELAVTVFQTREAAGMSQKELAGGANINLKTISQIENGTGNPSVKTLVRIAQALNQPLSISIG